jgi:hypothetical protein
MGVISTGSSANVTTGASEGEVVTGKSGSATVAKTYALNITLA